MSRSIVFSSQVYTLETIKKAAYRLSDALVIDIVPRDGEIECLVQFLDEPKTEEEAELLLAAFKTEVLDQDLRSIVAKETEATRNAILAFALSRTGLQGGE